MNLLRSTIGKLALLLVMVMMTASCATLFNDINPAVNIDSDPEGARVYVNGNYMGTTPVEVKLTVDRDHTIVFRKEGFEDKTYRLANEVGLVWIILDVLGGLIPIIVDAATGEWFELSEEYVGVVLEGQN